jgi:AcrR family transcriptional regulator
MAWAPKKSERFHASELQVPADRVLDAAFWHQLGGEDEPSMREKIILVSIDDLGRVGPATFNVKLVCEALGVSYSLINHHFGNRDELIAEASIRWYETYVQALWKAANAAPRDAEARLRAWLMESVVWASRYSGLAAVMNYPTASLDVTHLLRDKWQEQLSTFGELNLARLLWLIRELRANEVTDTKLEIGNLPAVQLRSDPSLMALNASVGWSILGLAVWSAGRHLPTGRVFDENVELQAAVQIHLNNIITIAKDEIAF